MSSTPQGFGASHSERPQKSRGSAQRGGWQTPQGGEGRTWTLIRTCSDCGGRKHIHGGELRREDEDGVEVVVEEEEEVVCGRDAERWLRCGGEKNAPQNFWDFGGLAAEPPASPSAPP